MILDVIARGTNRCDQGPSLRHQASAAGIHDDSESAKEGNSQGLGTPSSSEVVEHRSITDVGEAEGHDG
jgi:hypothetical protein